MLEPSGASSASAVLPNPLREGLAEERVPEPAVMVIFGASGDLTHRKLLPALYSLTRDRLLPSRFAIVGFARKPVTDDAFRDDLRKACDEFARRRPVDPALWSAFAQHVFYHQGNYDDPTSYAGLKARIEEIEKTLGLPGNRVFYLATPSWSFAPAIRGLGQSGLAPMGDTRARVIIEK